MPGQSDLSASTENEQPPKAKQPQLASNPQMFKIGEREGKAYSVCVYHYLLEGDQALFVERMV